MSINLQGQTLHPDNDVLELDWDSILRTNAMTIKESGTEQVRQLPLGTIAEGLVRTSSIDLLPSSIVQGKKVKPELRDATLEDVLDLVIRGESDTNSTTMNVAQCIDVWARNCNTAPQKATPEMFVQPPVPTATSTTATIQNTKAPTLIPVTAVGCDGPLFSGRPLAPQSYGTQQCWQQQQQPVAYATAAMPPPPYATGNAENVEIQQNSEKLTAAATRATRQHKRRAKQQLTSVRRKSTPQQGEPSPGAMLYDLKMEPDEYATTATGDANNGTDDESKGDGKSKKGRRAVRGDARAIRNRESAARSRARKQAYANSLEERVNALKEENKELRTKIIKVAKAPPDPHAGQLNGRPLRRTRTMPL